MEHQASWVKSTRPSEASWAGSRIVATCSSAAGEKSASNPWAVMASWAICLRSYLRGGCFISVGKVIEEPCGRKRGSLPVGWLCYTESRMLRCAVMVVMTVAVASARAFAAQPAADAGNLQDARPEPAGALLARARVELSAAPVGNPAVEKQALQRAEIWLRQALGQQPHDVSARIALGDVLVRSDRAAEAVTTLDRACTLARGPNQVFPCSLALADARAHAGQLVEALREYDRHLEIADPRTLPTVHIRAAGLHMALGRLHEAEARFGQAIDLLDQWQDWPERDSTRALALYGLAVAQDRATREI